MRKGAELSGQSEQSAAASPAADAGPFTENTLAQLLAQLPDL